MIEDKDTNFVYLSKWLLAEHPQFCRTLTAVMTDFGIQWDWLKYTNDYWARDYMPIQLGAGEFLKYRYNPDYLQLTQEDRESITQCRRACKAASVTYRETPLVIDGGNVVLCGDYVVLTDKVFEENRYTKGDPEFVAILERELGHKVILIPWTRHGALSDPNIDRYGHADGFIKYCGGNRILMSNHGEEYPEEAASIREELERYGFEVTEMRFDVSNPNRDYNWAYINFLQVGSNIFMPVFGIEEDRQARKYIKEAFPYCHISCIRMRRVVDHGGALHCVSWNILK